MTDNVVITRIFDAPRELVYKAWTDPELIRQWHGPEGFTAPHVQVDMRVGGRMLYCWLSPEGDEFWSGGVVREMEPPSRLVMTDYFADKDGNKVSPQVFGMGPDFPEESLVTLLFEALPDGKTKLTLEHSVPLDIANTVQMVEGWESSLDKLDQIVQQAKAAMA